MKSSFAATLLWVLNLGLLAGGFFFAYTLYSGSKKHGDTVRATMKNYHAPPIETWDGAKLGLDSREVPQVRLQPGAPHVIPKKVVDVPSITPAVVKEIVPSPDELAQEILVEMIKRYEIERVYVAGPHSSFSLKLSESNLALSGVIHVGQNLGQTLKKYEESAKRAKDPKASVIGGAGMDADIVAISTTAVSFRVTNDKVKKWMPKWKDEERPADGRLAVMLPVSNEKVPSLEDLVSGDFSTGGTSGSSSGSGGRLRPGAKEKPPEGELTEAFRDIPPPAATHNDAYERDPAWEKTVVHDDGSIQFGYEDMTQENVEELANYVSGEVDGNGRSVGLRLSDDFPVDNKLAKAAGARAGDVIKSINGQPVTSIAEVKRVVSKLRDAGETRFEVVYERNGVQQKKVFHSQSKKKK